MELYYDLSFVISLFLTIVYAFRWHKHFDVHFTLIFLLIPINNLGYMLYGHAKSLDAAIIGLKITYIGGCYLILMIMLTVFSTSRINIPRKLSAVLMTVCTVVFLSVLSIGYSPIFYRYISFEEVDGKIEIHKEYGFMHTVFDVMVVVYFAVSIAVLIYAYFRKRDVSRKLLYLQILPAVLAFITFYAGRKLLGNIYLVPIAYIIAQIMYLMIIDRMCLYDIDESAVDSLVQTGDTGFISFDKKINYLGCNETAVRIFPELTELTVDRPASVNSVIDETLVRWIGYFKEDESHDKFYYEKDDHIYLVDINYLYDGKRKRGYQFVITDDTKDQKYISLLDSYNNDLREQVAQKTAHIEEMHDKLILGMAAMVESRDNSTGGHIRRTSDVVRILIDEMKRNNELHLSDEFCKDIIKAAPMHDLGKIAVDDAVLRKPGRFTDEEFEKMKKHAAEGARIVHQILEGTDDINFHIIAENVAHYHHERWDGSGYPEGLKGEEIPLEARIMAIADVYDALVSKRVYKESMSFEQADSIIMDGMGKHFDKRLEKYYVSARPRLEQYYSSQS